MLEETEPSSVYSESDLRCRFLRGDLRFASLKMDIKIPDPTPQSVKNGFKPGAGFVVNLTTSGCDTSYEFFIETCRILWM